MPLAALPIRPSRTPPGMRDAGASHVGDEPDDPEVRAGGGHSDDFDDDGGNDGDRGGGGGGPVRWVTVATFWAPAEAHLARLRLEADDVACVILDENLVATDWLYASAVGGIKLQVPAGEAGRAVRLLRRGRGPDDVDPDADDGPAATGRGACPACASADVHRPLLGRRVAWAGVVSLLLGGTVLPLLPAALFVIYLILWRPWVCRGCGHAWTGPNHGPRGFPVEVANGGAAPGGASKER